MSYYNLTDRVGDDITTWVFPGGEIGVTIKDTTDPQERATLATIVTRLNTPPQLVELILVADALKRMGQVLGNLYVPYLPYARQDRVDIPGRSFSLKAIASVIDSLGFRSITVMDPHSLVAAACFTNTNFITIPVLPYIIQWIVMTNINTASMAIVCPDAGAEKRCLEIAKHFGCPIIQCSKVRDPKTGKLERYTAPMDYPKVDDYIVIDDICDGGGTFNLLAESLRIKKEKLSLFVTHGIFSKGFDELALYYSKIGYTNSWGKHSAKPLECNVTCIDII
jgi:ribose-phosphate pyrophosphokinase